MCGRATCRYELSFQNARVDGETREADTIQKGGQETLPRFLKTTSPKTRLQRLTTSYAAHGPHVHNEFSYFESHVPFEHGA